MRGISRSKWSTTSNINQIPNSQITPTFNASQTTTTNQAPDQAAVADQTSHPTKTSTTSHLTSKTYSILHRRSGADPAYRRVVQGYSELVAERMEAEWSCHLVTFLFVQLPGPRSVVVDKMKDELQRVYSTLVTRVHRKPRTVSPDQLPIFIAAADLPVYKRHRASVPTVHCNGGLHFHALLLIPPTSRLEASVDEHFRFNDDLYRGRLDLVRTIHVRPVIDGVERVVDYVFKTVLRGRVSYDEGILLLPRTSSELVQA